MPFRMSPEREKEIKDAVIAGGDDVTAIAKKVGCSRTTVVKMMAHIGVGTGWKFKAPRWPNELLEDLERRIRAGESAETIGAAFGRSPHAIFTKAGQLGLRVSKGVKAKPTAAPRPPAARPQIEVPKRTSDTAVTLLQKKHSQCSFPLWGHGERPGLFCGAPVTSPTCSYCAECSKIAFQPRPAGRQTMVQASAR